MSKSCCDCWLFEMIIDFLKKLLPRGQFVVSRWLLDFFPIFFDFFSHSTGCLGVCFQIFHIFYPPSPASLPRRCGPPPLLPCDPGPLWPLLLEFFNLSAFLPYYPLRAGLCPTWVCASAYSTPHWCACRFLAPGLASRWVCVSIDYSLISAKTP